MSFTRPFVVLLLVLLISASAVAAPVFKSASPGNTYYEWSANDWYNNGQTCQIDLVMSWYLNPGADNMYVLEGSMPVDPIVNQDVTNYTSELWSDWHVQLTNGWVVPGSAYVIKNGTTDPWTVTYDGSDPTKPSGFTAIAWPPASVVGTNDVLHIYFQWNPIDPGSRSSIKQWPTVDFVPEPGSILALGMGLASLGFGLRRRVK